MARHPEHPARPANAARSRGGELAAIARHAAVVLAGQLAAVAFGLADTLIAGRYSQDALAALSVSVAVYVTVQVGLMGLLQALLPVWAELRGAGPLLPSATIRFAERHTKLHRHTRRYAAQWLARQHHEQP